MALHRIQAVSRLLGIPAPTLRAWERRYGVPQPARTASSSYRLYGDDDLAVLRRMKALVDEGLPAGEAARIVLSGGVPAGPEAPPPDPAAEARDRILAAVARLDPAGIEAEVRRALPLGPAALVYERVLSPVLHEIGERWARGALSVAHEHLASTVIGAILRDLLRLVQPADPGRLAVLAAVEDDPHALGVTGAGLRLASWGFRVVDLGGRTPPAAIAEAVRTLAPDLVGLSAVLPVPGARGRALVDGYARACGDTVWTVGGPGAAGLGARIAARHGLPAGAGIGAIRPELERALALRRRPRRR